MTESIKTSGTQAGILIVEDSPVEAELLRRILARAGYAVSIAQNGEEGLQAARAHRPALVLSDINMPVMNGFGLCRAIKYDDELWNIPLILLTVLSEPEDIIEAINSGADAYIIKPYAEVNLLDRIRFLLDTPIERRRTEERRTEVVGYGGKRFAIATDGQQILNLLLSLYENTLHQNQELVVIQAQLNLLNESLDRLVRERTAALQESEARFRNLVETTSDWIWEIDENAVYVYTNPRIHNLLGYLPEEVIGKTPFDLMPAEEAQRVAKLFGAGSMAHEALVNLVNINLHQDGHRVVLETSAIPIIDQDGNFRGYRGIDRDISERMQAEEALARVNRALRTLSTGNHVLVRATSEEELLQATVRNIVENGGYCMARIIFAGDDPEKTLTCVASAGAGEDFYPAEERLTWADTDQGQMPIARAIRSGKVQICHDIATDPGFAPWKDTALARGYAAIIDLPLCSSARCFGTLSIYSSEKAAFDEEETKLLKELAEDLAYGITSLRARVNLQRLEMKNTLILNSVGAGIFGLDLQGRATFINLAGAAMLQRPEAEIVGQAMHALHHHSRADGTRYPEEECPISAAYRDNVAHRVAEEVFWKKDGTSFWVEYISTPMRDERDELVGSVVSFDDITQHKMDQDQLMKAKEQWEKTFDSILDEIITVQDKDFRILQANSAATSFFGIPREEIVGRHCYELFREDNNPCSECPAYAVLQEDKTHSLELYHERLKKHFLVTISPMVDETGKCFGLVHSAKDITGKKQLEQQLRQAQKMEAIGTLAGGIAHDFNNILTPILGYSELVVERLPSSSEECKLVQEIRTAGMRAKELVKQILTFSRQTEQQRQPVQIHLVIKEALKLLRSSIPATIVIHQNIVDCGTVMADPTQIHQVLMNLCTNAYHAMRETGGELSVSLSVIELTAQDYLDNLPLQPGPHVQLSVRDTGCGMSKELQERIFEPYFTTKKQGEGTGLGLSVVQGIVQSHHGHITVYSEPGHGTEFQVYLPQVKALDEGLAEEAETVAIPRGSGTVLVVDDEVAVGKLLREVLLSLGYEVVLCSSSTQALEAFQQNGARIDLVLTDMSMPAMNGAELTRRIKQLSPATPVVLCTGFGDIINEEKAKQLGIDGYLLKPIIKRQLAQTIHEVMGKKGTSGLAP